MAMPFEVYTDHYALQWLKTMRTGSALLHRWSAALEEYDFTVRHRPGKVQTHVDGLSRLPVGPAPPDDTLLHVEVSNEEEARRLAQELHTATHLGGQALWRLFSDRYSHKAGRRICIEVAQSCPQCQRGSDYGHHQKTTGTIESKGPWDTLSVDIVGPLPADRRHEFIIVFVDCYSRFTVLVPASNHTADTVSEALLRHVVPYFGTPRRLLSDRGREFVSEVWQKLTTTLGIQRVLTSPYHPEGNSINERSHRTMNNMLRARLLKDLPSRKWVAEIPGIMLALNAMVHEPHGFSASMIATGREPSLPPDLDNEACASPATADPVAYVDMVRQLLRPTTPITWNTAKETLLSRLGAGSVRDEAWVALKNLTRGTKEIIELAGEAEKLAKRLHPQDAEAVERHAVDAFLGALDRSIVAEVRKLGHTQMEGVVADARRIEKILQEQPTPAADSALEAMNRQIQILKKDLVKANERLIAQSTTPPQTASLALSASPTVAVAQPPPAPLAPQPKSQALVFPPQQPMPPPPHQYMQDYPTSYRQEDPPFYRRQDRRQDRRPARCFLCDEEGHFAYHCPACTLLQRLLRQESARRAPGGQVLELPPANGSSQAPPIAFKLTGGSPEAKVAPVGCAVAPPISGLLHIEGIPVEGLVDTGASVTCLGFAIWWRYRAQWGSLEPFANTVRGAHGKPLQIAGKTQHLDIQWGEARGRASFIVIVGLESPPCLIGMDIMRPLRVRIDVTEGTATPAQPDPQTIHLNAAQTQPQPSIPLSEQKNPLLPAQEAASQGASLPRAATTSPPLPAQQGRLPVTEEARAPSPAACQPIPPPGFPPAYPNSAHPHIASCARLLQTADIPPETARLVRCHNPWPSEDVLFCPDGALPAFVTGIPALSSGPELWYAVHNHWPEPLQLHAGQSIGVLEVVQLAEASAPAPPSSTHPTSPPGQPPLPENLSPLQQQQLNELFKEYHDVFSQGDEDLGNTPLLEHGIETHGPPLRQPYRRQNPAVRREEMTQVQQMLSSNVIRPSNSPWASPVVMVRKKDGSLRFCVDFRQLNAATVKDAHPLPRIDDLLDALHGAKWFSTLDLKSGYWQVPIAEQDKEKTAFRTSSGQLFEFNQVPFGLCNAPATFSRLMDRVLAGLHWETCLFYLDDIIVFSSTWEEHLARLREVFERLRQAKLKLGAAKCTFATKEVSYLGHRVTEEGLLPDPSLLAAIRDIPPPTTATEVRSFLGLAGYYRRYVKGFAAIAAPLFSLTRKEALFHWSEDCQAAFDQLKTRLTTSPITAFPDFSQAFRLYTDASTAGLGAILAQVRRARSASYVALQER